MRSSTRFYAAVFLISGVIMGLQILQSRLFSVTTWYHLSFLVISIAMFGLTLGALKIYTQNEKEVRKNYSLIARKAAYNCGIAILVALGVQLVIPLVSEQPWQTFFVLPFVAVATGAAYYYAGIILTVSLTRAPYPVGKIYGMDLLGAATGCLGALGLMWAIDTPSGLIVLAALAAFSGILYDAGKSTEAKKIKGQALLVCIVALAFAALNATLLRPIIYPLWAKGYYVPEELFSYDKWNPISRITIKQEKKDETPFLWGPSSRLPEDAKTSFSALSIDLEAGTPITRMNGDLSAHKYLEYDITNLAYSLPGLERAAIIGVGGGRDALSAKYFGVKDVIAMDVNPIQVNLLTKHPFYSDYAGLKNIKGLKIINSEARSWFRQNERPFDLIEMSLIDTWAATGAGAFALSENGLYTREAWSIFFHNLNFKGIFTVSRWSLQDYEDDTARLLSLAIATLFAEGITNVSDHIFLASTERIVTLILSKAPFTGEQLSALRRKAEAMDFQILAMPGRLSSNPLFKTLLAAKDKVALDQIAAGQMYDISPTSDMRPFFFNQARFSMPLVIAELAIRGGPSTLYGQAKATFNLFLIIGFSLIMTLIVIFLPIKRQMANSSYPVSFALNGSAFFFLIGIGFMLLEVSLLQAFGVYLGHPVYGLSIVLFSLILSTGVGSFLSEACPLETKAQRVIWALGIFGYSIGLAFGLGDLFSRFAEVSLVKRAVISVITLFPLGVLLGYAFPTGIKLAARRYSQSTAWFWGINGAAGVLGSGMAIAFNIGMGIDKTLLIAGFAYLLLVMPMTRLSQQIN